MSRTLYDSNTQSLFADAVAAQIAAAGANGGRQPQRGDELADRIVTDLRSAPVAPGPMPAAGQTPAVLAHLPGLLERMPSSPLADTLGPFMDSLDWYQIFDGGGIPDCGRNRPVRSDGRYQAMPGPYRHL